MVHHQIHFGKKFYQDKSTGYWISTTHPRIRAHVWVWISHHGKPPPRYHIHHKDGNKSNNALKNLELIEGSRHLNVHMTKERREWARKWIEVIRPMTKVWHASDEGREWHRKHGLECWKKKKKIKIKCKHCGLPVSTKMYHQEFCSNKCKSAWRRAQGFDDVNRECILCKTLFNINKYSKTQTCSRSCAAKLRWKKRKS